MRSSLRSRRPREADHHGVTRNATSVEACSAPSLAITSIRNSPGGSADERNVDVAQPTEPGGRHRQRPTSRRPSRFSIRAVSTGVPPALCAPTRTSSRSVRRNSRSMTGIAFGIGRERLPLRQRAPAKHLGRAQRQSQAQARHDDLSRFAIEHFARRVLDARSRARSVPAALRTRPARAQWPLRRIVAALNSRRPRAATRVAADFAPHARHRRRRIPHEADLRLPIRARRHANPAANRIAPLLRADGERSQRLGDGWRRSRLSSARGRAPLRPRSSRYNRDARAPAGRAASRAR